MFHSYIFGYPLLVLIVLKRYISYEPGTLSYRSMSHVIRFGYPLNRPEKVHPLRNGNLKLSIHVPRNKIIDPHLTYPVPRTLYTGNFATVQLTPPCRSTAQHARSGRSPIVTDSDHSLVPFMHHRPSCATAIQLPSLNEFTRPQTSHAWILSFNRHHEAGGR